MQPFFTVACIGCKNTRLIIIIEDGFIKAGDNLDEDVLIDVNDNHNNKYNMSAIVRMISKLLKNTYISNGRVGHKDLSSSIFCS